MWLLNPGSGKKRIGGCADLQMLRQDKGRISVRVRDGVRISNRVRRRVKLVNYSLITVLPIATSAHPLIRFLPMALKSIDYIPKVNFFVCYYLYTVSVRHNKE